MNTLKLFILLFTIQKAFSGAVSNFSWKNCENTDSNPRFDVTSVKIEAGEVTVVGTPSATINSGRVSFNIQRRGFLMFMGAMKTTLIEGEANICDLAACPLTADEEVTITKKRMKGGIKPIPGKYELEIEMFGSVLEEPDEQKLACIESQFSVGYMSYFLNDLSRSLVTPAQEMSIAKMRAEKDIKERDALAQKVSCNSNYCRQSPIDLISSAGIPIFYTLNQNESFIDLTYLNKVIPLRRGPNYLSYIVRNGFVKPANLRLNGKDYSLRNIHFHVPSEHTIDGKRFAAEVHFVHEAIGRTGDGSRKKFAVLGLFLEGGNNEPNSLDNLVAGLLESEAPLKVARAKPKFTKQNGEDGEKGNEEDDIGSLGDPSSLEDFVFDKNFLGDGDLFYYPGSLTTPPYSSDVTWLVARDPATVRLPLIKGMQALGVNNARSLQKSVSSSEVIRLVNVQTSDGGMII